MFKKVQIGMCFVLAAGFMFMWCFSKKNDIAVMTSGNLDTTIDKQVIVLDAGHGGMDGGCVSVNGVCEKQINLAIMEDLRDCLKVLGFDVVCTREDDVSIYDRGIEGLGNQKKSDMQNRLAIFNKYTDAISISIHQNQYTDEKYSGAQMFYSRNNAGGERLAAALQQQFAALLQPDNKRETKPVDDELYLLDNTKCPAVMAECGFLSNNDEAQKLESEQYQKQVAFTIMTGIFEFVGEKA